MLAKRIILLFFRDKANVFFSLLAVLIIIGLYVLFLGDMMVQGLEAQLGFHSNMIAVTMASITLAGMIAVTSVTSCMGAMGISIEDKEVAAKDFLTSPASRSKITLGYILGSASIGLILTIIALALCVVYIVSKGGNIPSATDMALLLMTSVLSVLCGISMVYFFCSFVKTSNAFSAISTVIGTLIGFLMGIYIPIGNFPNAVQWVIKCFPMSHAASMFRLLLADRELADLFSGAPPEVLEQFRELFGIVFVYGDQTSTFWLSAAYLTFSTTLFSVLSLIAMRLQKRK